MSDHLPECPQIFGKPDWYCCEDCDPGVWDDCICDRLRACEQRVNDDWVRDYGGHRAFALGVQAAREAVAAVGVRKDTSHDMRVQALAAIDALSANADTERNIGDD